jgi:hypothetical protein
MASLRCRHKRFGIPERSSKQRGYLTQFRKKNANCRYSISSSSLETKSCLCFDTQPKQRTSQSVSSRSSPRNKKILSPRSATLVSASEQTLSKIAATVSPAGPAPIMGDFASIQDDRHVLMVLSHEMNCGSKAGFEAMRWFHLELRIWTNMVASFDAELHRMNKQKGSERRLSHNVFPSRLYLPTSHEAAQDHIRTAIARSYQLDVPVWTRESRATIQSKRRRRGWEG